MNRTLLSLATALPLFALPSVASAHVSIASGPAFAGKSQAITFGIGHGCEGADTSALRIEIPAAITTVRAMPSAFGQPSLEHDGAGRVTAVTWQKPDATLAAQDENYYELTLRITVPDAPFTRLYFPAHQTCKKLDGTVLSTDWIALPGAEGEPAPELKILPVRQPGWNKFTMPAALDSLDAFFSDALIVWKGNAAWSANQQTTALIAGTPGASALTSLAAGDEIQVRY